MSTYFKNTELASRYNISEGTVRNWIKTTEDGKLALVLIRRDGHAYVANNISNILIMEELVARNRKYRNTRAAKTIKPAPEFYDIFSRAQIYDIVRNLELHNEIPRQYGYFGEGALEWNDYINRQLAIDAPSMVRRTQDLISANLGYIDKRLAGYKSVNIIDIGVGNAAPVRGLLSHLIEEGRLGRYIALDFSKDMLNMARNNLVEWFDDRIQIEAYQIDIAHERFGHLIAEDYLSSKGESINLVLCLGATPDNFRFPADAFRTISESMNPQDLFIYTDKLEAPDALPEWFEYSIKPSKTKIHRRHRLVLDKLNIIEQFYGAEIGYDAKLKQRYSRVKLKYAVRLDFDLLDGSKAVRFEKGDVITLWRCWQATHRSVLEVLEQNGLYVLHTSQSEDHEYILAIAEVQPSRWNS